VTPTAPHVNLPPSGAWWDVAPARGVRPAGVEDKRESTRLGRASAAVARMSAALTARSARG
jgi:hypothetical protein